MGHHPIPHFHLVYYQHAGSPSITFKQLKYTQCWLHGQRKGPGQYRPMFQSHHHIQVEFSPLGKLRFIFSLWSITFGAFHSKEGVVCDFSISVLHGKEDVEFVFQMEICLCGYKSSYREGNSLDAGSPPNLWSSSFLRTPVSHEAGTETHKRLSIVIVCEWSFMR